MLRPSWIWFAFGLFSAAGCDHEAPAGESSPPPRSGRGGGCGDTTVIDRRIASEETECKVEGTEIGQAGLSLELGTSIVTFESWWSKEGESNEYVGFTLTVQGEPVDYQVKAGTEVFASSDLTWVHPAGTGGSDAHAISNVDFCDDGGEMGGDEGGGGDEGDGDGGGDDCPEPPPGPYID